MFGASYAGGKHRLEHVDATMYFYGEIRKCTCNWQWKLLLVWLTVSRVGDIHWRLIAGDTGDLLLVIRNSWHFNMWMEGHKPLLFTILYHILKFISVSLGTDVSNTRNNIGPSTVPCVLSPKSQVWYVMISLQDQQFYPSHKKTIEFIQIKVQPSMQILREFQQETLMGEFIKRLSKI